MLVNWSIVVFQDAARAAGAIFAVIASLKAHRTNRGVGFLACRVLGTLSIGNAINQACAMFHHEWDSARARLML
jgi:hypothetical protein